MSDVYADRSVVAQRYADGPRIHRRVSWGALFGGAVLALSVQLILSLLGAGIGFDNVNVAAGSTPSASSFGTSAGIWWVVSSCIALFAGGFTAAWLAGSEIKFDGLLHGLVVWGIATLVTIYLLTSAVGGIIGGGLSALTSTASAVGGGVKDAAKPIANAVGLSPDMIKQQADAYLQPANPDPAAMSPQDAQKAIAQNLVTYEKGGPDAAAAKQRIIAITAAQLKISEADATQKFDAAQAKLQQTLADAKQKATAAADDAAAAAAKTSFALFVDLLLGAIAAAIGGLLGGGYGYRRGTVETRA